MTSTDGIEASGVRGAGAMGDRQATFGPSALATPANLVTVARLAATPVVMALVALHGPGLLEFFSAFVVAATDGLDGWIARRQGTTRSGAFLDPLADKAVVLGLLAVVAARGEVGWLPVVLIGAREVWMSTYRVIVARRGVSVPARRSAKVKTVIQDLAVGICLLPTLAIHHDVLQAGLWVAVVFTLVSGAQYMVDGRRAAGRATPAGKGPLA
ncbi:MAG: CDP-alcohol phosphatidyltransferase family protein [Acidimicrobiales bacterium]